MSNEYKDWLTDKECERSMLYVANKIYEYAYNVFFGTTQQEKEFRRNYGAKGAETKVLNYIWNEFIAPYEEE